MVVAQMNIIVELVVWIIYSASQNSTCSFYAATLYNANLRAHMIPFLYLLSTFLIQAFPSKCLMNSSDAPQKIFPTDGNHSTTMRKNNHIYKELFNFLIKNYCFTK